MMPAFVRRYVLGDDARVIPFLSIHGQGEVNVYSDPFAEDFRDPGQRDYLVGSGYGAVGIEFARFLPQMPDIVMTRAKVASRHTATVSVEFDVYATEDTLDEPRLRRIHGVLARGPFQSLWRDNLVAAGEVSGLSRLRAALLPRVLDSHVPDILASTDARRLVGAEVCRQLGRCGSGLATVTPLHF